LKKNFFSKNDNHALIFSSFKSEMSKSRIVDKVTALMPLSHEEAYNMVNRTPIIVLDNMDRGEGEKLRNYFDTEGCELVLTEDTFVKRKCYRILWPEKPVLDYEKVEQPRDHQIKKLAPAEPAQEAVPQPTAVAVETLPAPAAQPKQTIPESPAAA